VEAQDSHHRAVQSMHSEKEEIRQKLIKKFIYTMMNSCLGKCYSAWASWVATRRHQRKLVGKVFGKVENREIGAAITSWKSFVQWKREHILKVSNRSVLVERGLNIITIKHNALTLRNSNLKKSFIKWMLATYTGERGEASGAERSGVGQTSNFLT